MNQTVGGGSHDDDTEGQGRDVLLKFQISIQGDENVTDISGAPQQFTVLCSGPAQPMNCQDLMIW